MEQALTKLAVKILYGDYAGFKETDTYFADIMIYVEYELDKD